MSLPVRLSPAALLTSGHIAAKALRFGSIGVLSGTIFAVVTALLVSGLGVAPVPASVAGYCVSVPASFLGHRQFSFRSSGHWPMEALKFVIVQAVNIAVTAGSMALAVDWLGGAYGWGMAAAVILVPLANFLVMNFWIFRSARRRSARRGGAA